MPIHESSLIAVPLTNEELSHILRVVDTTVQWLSHSPGIVYPDLSKSSALLQSNYSDNERKRTQSAFFLSVH